MLFALFRAICADPLLVEQSPRRQPLSALGVGPAREGRGACVPPAAGRVWFRPPFAVRPLHGDPLAAWRASAAPAGAGPDPTRVGSRRDPGFARRGEAAPSPASLGSLPGDALAA